MYTLGPMTAQELTPWERIVTVAQASGIVVVQAQCTPSQAYILMTARGELTRRSIEEVAVGVLAHSTRFD